jgi:hypothetical protein
MAEYISVSEPLKIRSTFKEDNRKVLAFISKELKRLRLEHLNVEERKQIQKTCLNHQDIFHLGGKVLSSATAAGHKIRLEPGTEPVIARTYRLP